MRKWRVGTATVALLVGVGMAVVPNSPAMAINRTSCSNVLTGVVRVVAKGGDTCWANRGKQKVFLRGVTYIRAGNNDVVLTGPGTHRRVNRHNLWHGRGFNADAIQIY
jgi:hypothetical protein